MFINRSKLLIRGVVLGLLLCVVGIVAWYRKSTDCFYPGRSPLNSFLLTIDPDQQRFLIEQSEKFADTRGFKFDIANDLRSVINEIPSVKFTEAK